MTDEVRFLFHQLADLSPGDRERAFREQQVLPEIRAEVESLLDFDSANVQGLTDCVSHAAEQVLDAARGPEAACGPYRLVRLLGSGGMGSVYLAERTDGEIQQKVAVKLLRADSHRPAWRERFLRERQLLASLNHPSIVHVIDAGHTDADQPYLVMEYVDGVPIDVYGATIELRERLALFLGVCDGVAHAHRRLIIHRDLKPSNILVGPFGLAQAAGFRHRETARRDRGSDPDGGAVAHAGLRQSGTTARHPPDHGHRCVLSLAPCCTNFSRGAPRMNRTRKRRRLWKWPPGRGRFRRPAG
jgi:serine/threonine protein kinase